MIGQNDLLQCIGNQWHLGVSATGHAKSENAFCVMGLALSYS